MKTFLATKFLCVVALLAPALARAQWQPSPARELENRVSEFQRLAVAGRHHGDAREASALAGIRELALRSHEYLAATREEPRDRRRIASAYEGLDRAYENVAASSDDLHGEVPVQRAWQDVREAMDRVRERAGSVHDGGPLQHRPSGTVVPAGTTLRLVFDKPLCSDRLPDVDTDVWLRLERDLVADGTRIAERGGLAAVGTALEGDPRSQGGQRLVLKFRGIKLGDQWIEVFSEPVRVVAHGRRIDDSGTYRSGPRPALRGNAICIPTSAIYEFRLSRDLVVADDHGGDGRGPDRYGDRGRSWDGREQGQDGHVH